VIPDLVVEVASSGDRPSELRQKAAMWLEAGVRLVWVALPAQHVIEVYRAGQPITVLDEGATLDGADVVPGFSTPVAAIFP
jgi:Uma2 family endonuclease